MTRRKSDYLIAESIKEPLIGQVAYSTEKECTVIWDGDKWLQLMMPHFFYSLTDLKKEKYEELLTWIKMVSPHCDPEKIAPMISVSVDWQDVIKMTNLGMNALTDFIDD